MGAIDSRSGGWCLILMNGWKKELGDKNKIVLGYWDIDWNDEMKEGRGRENIENMDVPLRLVESVR